MNIHQPDESVRERWPEWDWRGSRWTKAGRTWIRAKHKVMGWQWYYCFERDCFLDDVSYKMETDDKPAA